MDVPGLVVYNESSQQWWNISTGGEDGYTYMGTAREGAAHFVPTFGPEGLLFVFGGFANEDTLMPFDEAYMFEPVSQRWRKQQVTGTPPAPASGQCVVGVQGDNGTYEVSRHAHAGLRLRRCIKGRSSTDRHLQIFLHGGITGDTTTTVAQGAVWSLTLPAFHWQQHSANATYGRFRHSCNTAASGSRQMIVVGGAGVTEDSTLGSIPRDPWEQGIGIYDLSVLNWTTGFDPNAEKYVTPDVIKAFYRENGTFPATWTEEGMSAWFDKSNNPADGEESSPTEGTGSSGSTSAHESSNGDNGTSAGTIAGSIVGAIGGLAVLVGLGWLLVRRSRRASGVAGEGEARRGSRKMAEMDGHGQTVVELPAGPTAKEMPTRNSWYQGRMKVGHSSVHELYSPDGGGGDARQEEWPSEKCGVTAAPSMVHPSRRSDHAESPV